MSWSTSRRDVGVARWLHLVGVVDVSVGEWLEVGIAGGELLDDGVVVETGALAEPGDVFVAGCDPVAVPLTGHICSDGKAVGRVGAAGRVVDVHPVAASAGGVAE